MGFGSLAAHWTEQKREVKDLGMRLLLERSAGVGHQGGDFGERRLGKGSGRVSQLTGLTEK